VASIDFGMLRCQIGMEAVLSLLGFTCSQRRDGQVRGPCPIHKPRSARSRSFSAHLERNVYHCFRCGSRGNQLDLWTAATRQPLYQAAIDLCEKLHRPVPRLSRPKAARKKSVPNS
jgi:DNA primase